MSISRMEDQSDRPQPVWLRCYSYYLQGHDHSRLRLVAGRIGRADQRSIAADY